MTDADARDNYGVVLRFRERLLRRAPSRAATWGCSRAAMDVPPLFIDQMAHVILRNVLDGSDDPLRLRAAELFFREQKATIQDGHVLLADLETVRDARLGQRATAASAG